MEREMDGRIDALSSVMKVLPWSVVVKQESSQCTGPSLFQASPVVMRFGS